MPERTIATRRSCEYSGRHERSRRASGRRTRQTGEHGNHRDRQYRRNTPGASCRGIRAHQAPNTIRLRIRVWVRTRRQPIPRCIPVPTTVRDAAASAVPAATIATGATLYAATPVFGTPVASRKRQHFQNGQQETATHHHGNARMRNRLWTRATGVHIRRHVRVA